MFLEDAFNEAMQKIDTDKEEREALEEAQRIETPSRKEAHLIMAGRLIEYDVNENRIGSEVLAKKLHEKYLKDLNAIEKKAKNDELKTKIENIFEILGGK